MPSTVIRMMNEYPPPRMSTLGIIDEEPFMDISRPDSLKKELWQMVWELNRLKRFENLDEYKKRVSRKITKEDAPAIININDWPY